MDPVKAPELNPADVAEQTRGAISNIRRLTEQLRHLLEHERIVAGDLLEAAEQTLRKRHSSSEPLV